MSAIFKSLYSTSQSIKSLCHFEFCFRLGVYVVNTMEGLFIKKIEVKNDRIVLKSTNKSFIDIKVNTDDINIIGRVCGVLLKV